VPSSERPDRRLKEAVAAARAGRYEDALSGYTWFHEHALEHDRAFYGVRLSFALASWMELAQVYPPALAALRHVRDRKAALLLAGRGTRETFHDVESINERLAEDPATRDLFAYLAQHQPSLATECADLALRALVKVGDFERAYQYVDPKHNLKQWAEAFNDDVAAADARPGKAPVREAHIHNYAERVLQLVRILRGLGKSSEAQRFRVSAIDALESPHDREAVRTKFDELEEIADSAGGLTSR